MNLKAAAVPFEHKLLFFLLLLFFSLLYFLKFLTETEYKDIRRKSSKEHTETSQTETIQKAVYIS